ncbi:hypothetical protein [Pseudalkalibacillus berkeleyi]|uniref:Uncharacterized protein n=1 Tax=Pseudalkalibacillus berkeleyi TaxID=1069813 RepID=A0ABS9GX01_9BACL|nr:hypothetical protein [Pseudalkalibacillus berkeleyi]MCF6136351.1 hypothetical protein [Pseudalkalibacillus berkeleyi]
MIFASAILAGILLIVLISLLIKTPEEEANDFVERLKSGTVNENALNEQQLTELNAFIQFPNDKDLDQTRMVIYSAEDVDNGYQVRVRFQAYEYKDEGSKVIESYDGDLYIIMQKVGFRSWNIIDVKINAYK